MLHCIVLHRIAVYCIALHHDVQHCIILHCIVYCIALHYTAYDTIVYIILTPTFSSSCFLWTYTLLAFSRLSKLSFCSIRTNKMSSTAHRISNHNELLRTMQYSSGAPRGAFSNLLTTNPRFSG